MYNKLQDTKISIAKTILSLEDKINSYYPRNIINNNSPNSEETNAIKTKFLEDFAKMQKKFIKENEDIKFDTNELDQILPYAISDEYSKIYNKLILLLMNTNDNLCYIYSKNIYDSQKEFCKINIKDNKDLIDSKNIIEKYKEKRNNFIKEHSINIKNILNLPQNTTLTQLQDPTFLIINARVYPVFSILQNFNKLFGLENRASHDELFTKCKNIILDNLKAQTKQIAINAQSNNEIISARDKKQLDIVLLQ